MQLPPDLLSAGTEITTSATIGANTSTALVGAPGAGFRLRIWGWTIALDRQYDGPVFGVFVDSSSASGTGYLGLGSSQRSQNLWVPGGFAYPANRGSNVTLRANLASQHVFTNVFYTLESA